MMKERACKRMQKYTDCKGSEQPAEVQEHEINRSYKL
jgi:hypothetical protein